MQASSDAEDEREADRGGDGNRTPTGDTRRPAANTRVENHLAWVLAAIEELAAMQVNDIVIVKARDENARKFHVEVDRMCTELEADKKNGIVQHFPANMAITVRTANKTAKQKMFEKLKSELQKRSLKARALSGSSCIKRILEQPARSAFIEISNAFKEATAAGDRVSLTTVWPKSVSAPSWGLRSPREEQEVWHVTGSLKQLEGTNDFVMEIACRRRMKINDVTLDGTEIMRMLKRSFRDRWIHYPFEIRWQIAEKLKNPITAKGKGKGKKPKVRDDDSDME